MRFKYNIIFQFRLGDRGIRGREQNRGRETEFISLQLAQQQKHTARPGGGFNTRFSTDIGDHQRRTTTHAASIRVPGRTSDQVVQSGPLNRSFCRRSRLDRRRAWASSTGQYLRCSSVARRRWRRLVTGVWFVTSPSS
jgi:hypothetical protein